MHAPVAARTISTSPLSPPTALRPASSDSASEVARNGTLPSSVNCSSRNESSVTRAAPSSDHVTTLHAPTDLDQQLLLPADWGMTSVATIATSLSLTKHEKMPSMRKKVRWTRPRCTSHASMTRSRLRRTRNHGAAISVRRTTNEPFDIIVLRCVAL